MYKVFKVGQFLHSKVPTTLLEDNVLYHDFWKPDIDGFILTHEEFLFKEMC